MRNLAQTKIVSTLGPASTSEEMIRKLYRAGVTMFRLNSSHGDMETHQKTLDTIRKIEKEEHTIIPVLLDLQGPKIRVGQFEANKSRVVITTDNADKYIPIYSADNQSILIADKENLNHDKLTNIMTNLASSKVTKTNASNYGLNFYFTKFI